MDEQKITIPMKDFEDLMKTKAEIHALQCYVSSEKYPNRKVMCDIVGVSFDGED